ncbi:MAG TPA: glycosyltransferase [Paenirhodobacter sp.]
MTQADFFINGRFLTQKVTGVQRYARNVVAALDQILPQAGVRGDIITPQGGVNGHVWEQFTLPLRAPGRLLNLCNTAPAVKADQIVCIHDANIFTAPHSYGRGFRTVYGLLQPLLARRAARITTVSHFAARQIARYLPVRVSDIVVLPNGHEHALNWNPDRADKARQIYSGRPFVLAIGSQARHKNMELLANIAPDLDAAGIDVIIAGGGGAIFANATLAAAPNLHLTGPVTDDDLAFLMDHALCLAFPSWTEGFGLPIIEAMARGCPVISSDRASMPDICGDAALLAAPDAPQTWLRQIIALKGSNTLRGDLTGRGREQMLRFSWAETAAGYLHLLRDPTQMVPQDPISPPHGKVAVVVATRGRPDIVSATVRHLAATQTLQPDRILISCTTPGDAGDLADLPGVQVLTGQPGLPAQRNTALDALPPDTEVVAFFDDDFVADRDWLAVALRGFRDDPVLVGFTGRVLADGINGPGLSFETARHMVAAPPPRCGWSWRAPYSPYGCNMAFRFAAIGPQRFDERLVLYGWLEDRDFAAALTGETHKALAKCAAARGVHMGTKGGRVSGLRFGYSQIANPLYMLRKHTMTPTQAVGQILRNMSSNAVLSLRPEPWVDRRGRLRGNLLGLADVIRGRFTPERAADL